MSASLPRSTGEKDSFSCRGCHGVQVSICVLEYSLVWNAAQVLGPDFIYLEYSRGTWSPRNVVVMSTALSAFDRSAECNAVIQTVLQPASLSLRRRHFSFCPIYVDLVHYCVES